MWTLAVPAAWANHSTDDVNCSAFSTRAEALAYLNQHPGDPDNLDTDNDGIPCEDLPAGGGDGGTTTTTMQPIDLSCDVVVVEPDGTVRVPPGCPPVTRPQVTPTTVALREPLVRTGAESNRQAAAAAILVACGALVLVVGGRRSKFGLGR